MAMQLVEDLDLRLRRTVVRPGSLTQHARVQSLQTQLGVFYSGATHAKQQKITKLTTDWVKALMDIDADQYRSKGSDSREFAPIHPAMTTIKPHPAVWYIKNDITVNEARQGIIYSCKNITGFLSQDALLMAIYWKKEYIRRLQASSPVGKKRPIPQPRELQPRGIKVEYNASLTGGRTSVMSEKAKAGDKAVPYFPYTLLEIYASCKKLKALDETIYAYLECDADVRLKPENLPVVGKKGCAILLLAHLHRKEVETQPPTWDKMMVRGILELVKVRSKAAEKFDALFGLTLARPQRVESLVKNSEYASLDLNRSADRTKMKQKLEKELKNTGDALKYTEPYKIFKKIYHGSPVTKL